jgi:hypothetical protein
VGLREETWSIEMGRGEREESKKEASSPHGGGDYLFVYKHIIGKRVKSSIEITSKLILSH